MSSIHLSKTDVTKVEEQYALDAITASELMATPATTHDTDGAVIVSEPAVASDKTWQNYLSPAEVADLGLASTGTDVLISRDARLYGESLISIGSHVRIDAFTFISAGAPIVIGNHVHIAPFCSLSGAGGIILEDFSGLSGHVLIYSSSDDYSGATMTNPTVPAEFRNVKSALVRLGRYVIVGAGTVVLPGASIGEGSAVGALSLVSTPLPKWKIFTGNPVRLVGRRRHDVIELAGRLLEGGK